jgi:hypothetical protein
MTITTVYLNPSIKAEAPVPAAHGGLRVFLKLRGVHIGPGIVTPDTAYPYV